MIALILDHLWQSTLFAAGMALLTLLLGRNGARVRYWLWFAASAKFIIPFSLVAAAGKALMPVITAPDTVQSINQATAPFSIATADLSAGTAAAAYLTFALFAAWWVGTVASLLLWFARWEILKSVLAAARPSDISAPIPVRESSVMLEPGLVGIWKPTLLLPEGITAWLSPQEMYGVVAHELCHLERRDNVTAAIHMLVQSLFWFHPMTWWIGGRLVDERERACDEAVLECGNDPESYAQGILKICQHYVRNSLACASGISGADLKKRVEAIMANRGPDDMGLARKAFISVAASATLLLPLSGELLASPASGDAAVYTQKGTSGPVYRRYMQALENGAARHDELGLALVLQAERPVAELVKRFGAFKSVTYRGLSRDGWEVYDVAFESARAEWRIAPGTGAHVTGKLP